MKLESFVSRQREVFKEIDPQQDWESNSWNVNSWLRTRGTKNLALPFNMLGSQEPLPQRYADFAKGIIVAIYQKKRPSHAALNAYLIETRRLFKQLSSRDLTDPTDLVNGHFNDSIEELRSSGYKNLYDAASNLAVIAALVDQHEISRVPLDFVIPVATPTPRMRHDPKVERTGLSSKLPSKEAMEAFAFCTNNPINDREEILLRIIDLHISMGTRINETLHIPEDCWIEQSLLGADGKPVIDPISGTNCKEYGIRYYPEKKFEHNVHWLADSDVPLARRAIERLRTLTQKARDVARWQYENPGRLWDINPEKWIRRSLINKFIETAQPYDVNRIMKRLNIPQEDYSFGDPSFRAGDIEQAFLTQRSEQVVLSKNGKAILHVHECLCIGFEGYFRFKERVNSVNWLLPALVNFEELSGALGNTTAESIFDRRNLTEADGSRISLRSHQSRHWRNTLYKLGGMTEIQQALAMGRKDIKQNPYYQHVALDTELANHSAFVEFTSYQEKVMYLKSGIESGKIQGALADTFHSLKLNSPVSAQDFLDTHAGGVHVTLWGVCTNDFSREPCQKHLQCFDSCGHLHRTDNQWEDKNLRNLLKLNKEILQKMKLECDGDAGSDKWIAEQERKISGIEKAISLGSKVNRIPVKVFPDSPGLTQSKKLQRGSSV